MSRWFRYYDDAVNDPKIIKLSDDIFRAWVNLLCVASKHQGLLPAVDDIAIILRVKVGRAAAIIAELVSLGLLDKTCDGFAPHNWSERQYKSDSSAERMKRHRDRQRDVTVTVQNRTEADTEQSRADARAVVSSSEKVLRTDLMEAFGPSRAPDLSRAGVWLAKGYSSTMIVEVVRELLARKPDISSLNYFDAALAERHANRPESPSEKAASAANIDMDKVVAMYVKTGVWSKYAGPEPGMLGCRCPPEILQKHGVQPAPILRAMQ